MNNLFDKYPAARDMETWLKQQGGSVDSVDTESVQKYLDHLIAVRRNERETLVDLARFFYYNGQRQIYIYFTSVLGGSGVMDSIEERCYTLAGSEAAEKIFGEPSEPPLGSSPSAYPPFTSAFMDRLQTAAGTDLSRRILAGNNHGISPEGFQKEKELFEAAESLDIYLKGRHDRNVAVLQEHCDTGKVWFEQLVTQDAVDLVKNNPEMLSAVREGNKLYITKIPYAPHEYIHAENELEKRHFACHCTFARESIAEGKTPVTGEWCNCSAGFAKFPFEVIFGESLEVKVLENVLDGSDKCRFAVTLPDRLVNG